MMELSEKGSVFQILALNDKTKTWLSLFAKIVVIKPKDKTRSAK